MTDAEAVQSPFGGYRLIKEVLHGLGAIEEHGLSFESPLLAIAIPYAGNFLVYSCDGHAGAFSLHLASGTVDIFSIEDPCDQGGLISQITLPLAGPIPDSCLIDAWIFTTPRGVSQEQAAQMIADTYAVEP